MNIRSYKVRRPRRKKISRAEQASRRRPRLGSSFEQLEDRKLLAGDFVAAPIDPAQTAGLLSGLEAFADWASEINQTGPLSDPLALVTADDGSPLSIGQVIDAGDVLKQELLQPMQSYVEGLAEADRNTDGLVEFLESLPKVTSVSGGLATTPSEELRFEVTLEDVASIDALGIDFGSNGESLGLAMTNVLDAQVIGTMGISFAFGLSLDPDLNSEQAFFLRGTEINLSADADVVDAAGDLTVGFLATSATADINLETDALVTLHDLVPDALSNVTLSELNGYAADAIASTTITTNALTAAFDLSTTLGSWTTSGTPKITATGAAVGQTNPAIQTNADFAGLLDFNNVNANELIAGLELFGTFLDGFATSSVLRESIPFADGATLGNQFVGSTEFLNQITTFRGQDGQPLFRTAQEFAELVGVDAEYDAVGNRLIFPIEMNFANQRSTWPLTLGDGIDSLTELVTSSQAELISSGSVEFELAVDLSKHEQPTEQQFSTDNVVIHGRVDQNAARVGGSTRYGLVGVDFTNGSYAGTSEFRAELGDPGSAATEATLGELMAGLAAPESVLDQPLIQTGDTTLVLDNVTVQDGLFNLPAGASVTLSVADYSKPESTSVSMLNTGMLGSFANLTIESLTDSLAEGIAAAVDWTDANADALSLLGVTLVDIVDQEVFEHVATAVAAGFDAYETATGVAARLQDVTAVLANEVSTLIGSTLAVAGNLAVDTVAERVDIGINVTAAAAAQLIDFGLSISELAAASGEAALDGIGEFAGGGDPLDAEVSTDLQFDFEFDLSDAANPQAYLATTSGLTAGIYINEPGAGPALEASGSLGVLEFGLDDGSLVVAASRTAPAPAAPATFTVGLDDSVPEGRYPVDQLNQARLESSANGQMEFNYHIAQPGIVAGGDRLQFQVDDLNLPANTTSLIGPPDFATLIASIDLTDDLAALPDALDDFLGSLEEALQFQVFGLDFPLIGDAVDQVANFVRDLRADLAGAWASLTDFAIDSVTTAIESVVNTKLSGSVSVDLDDLDDIRFTVTLSDLIKDNVETNTNLGLPALGASFDANLSVGGGYTLELTFGISKTHGVYIDTTNETISVDLDVDVDGTLAGRLGFIEVSATADTSQSTCTASNNQPTAFHGEFSVGLTDANDGKLTLAEMAAGDFIDMPNTGLDGCADIDLNVGAGLNLFGEPITWMPSIETTISIDWNFDGSDLSGNVPEVSYEGLGINLGDFLSQNVGPLLEGVDSLFDGIQVVLDVIADPFPVIGDLIPDPDSLIEVATAVFPFLEPLEIFAEILDQIGDLAQAIEVTSSDAGTVIEFGTLRFGLDKAGKPDDTYDARRSDLSVNLDDQVLLAGGDSALDQLLAGAPDFGTAFGNAQTSGAELAFPLLEQPLGLFEFVLGIGEAEIVTFTLPSLDVAVPIDLTVDVIPLILEAGIFGSIEAFFNLSFGYDTAGFRQFLETGEAADLLLGFYASDTAAPDGSGSDIDQLSFRGSALAGVGTGIDGILEAHVGGGLEADLAVDLLDHNGDGKVRGDEFVSPAGCLELSGGLAATLEAEATVLFTRHRFPFASASIGDFHEIVRCSLPGAPAPPTETLANLTSSGKLNLYVGDKADKRSIEPNVVDESFSVMLIDDLIVVSAFGAIQEFEAADVVSIHADAKSGDDRITVDASVTQPVELLGGEGNDVLLGGSGEDTIDGGLGDDTIEGGGGSDSLVGGEGHDTIQGGDESGPGDTIDAGSGDDVIHGGDGDDTILTGDGLNTVYGDAGDDTITGGMARDVIYGGDDDDEIRGEDGDDVLSGDGGNDDLFGGEGTDEIDGGSGGDTIEGNGGADTIFGGDQDDDIQGNEDDDYIDGGAGADTIAGNGGADTIHGGANDDTIQGNGGDDWLFGEGGEDEIHGNRGIDNIQGGSESDDLFGDAGNDVIDGNEGGDEIQGGLGDDLLLGSDGADTIYGNDGPDGSPIGAEDTDRDTIFGGDAGDTIHGDDDLDFIDGGDGKDIIHGNLGNDTVEGGDGSDTIFGDDGEDDIRGGAGDDTIDGGNQSDLIRGGEGADDIFGQSGSDTLFGDEGDDYIEGGTHGDLIDGGAGNDHLLGQGGDDEIFGNFGDDVLEGNDGDDLMRGNDGNDVMYGDNGADELTGGRGNDTMRGGADDDLLRGGEGDDLILGHTGVDMIFGEFGDDVLYGYLGDDLLDGGAGNDRAMGELGDDTLLGGIGDDLLEGGPGNDNLSGGNGNDQLHGDEGVDNLLGGADDDFLWAGEGIGNRLRGNDGDDHIVGSDAGSDDPNLLDSILFGDFIEGGDGNDLIESLGGADIINGGRGDDTISGGMHGDFIIGGPAAAPAGFDNDQIHGQAGDDRLAGGAGDDVITGGDGSNTIDGGTGANTIDLTPEPAPTFVLSQGPDLNGDWVELSGSATGQGLTQVGGFEESMFANQDGVYVTWVDWRNGNSEVYLAYHPNNGGDWVQFDDSATGGGISHDAEQSRRPTVVEIENFNQQTGKTESELIVAWTKIDASGASTIEVRRLDDVNGWSPVSDPMLQSGTADYANLVPASDESALLGWLDTSTGLSHVNVIQYIFEPACYVNFWGGSDVTAQINPTADVAEYDLAAARYRAAVASSFGPDGGHDIDVAASAIFGVLDESTLCPTSGFSVDVLTVGGPWWTAGTFTEGDNVEPTVGMQFIRERSQGQFEIQIETDVYVAWHRTSDREDQVESKVIRQDFTGRALPGVDWEDMAPQYYADATPRTNANGVSDTVGYAAKPAIATSDEHVFLTWMDDGVHKGGDGRSSVFVMSAAGVERVLHEILPHDASSSGISPTGGALKTLSITVAAEAPESDAPYVAWTEADPGMPQVYLRHDQEGSTGTTQKLGDFNGDRKIDVADIDAVRSGIRTGSGPFDLDGDGQVRRSDLEFLVEKILVSSIGDANLDGLFDSSDIVKIFQVGEYEDGILGNSTWGDGDWDGDGEFSTGDLVYAFQRGRYRSALAAALDDDLIADVGADRVPQPEESRPKKSMSAGA